MILPDDERCREVIAALCDEPNLTDWEYEFVESNAERKAFTVSQREVVERLSDKYEV